MVKNSQGDEAKLLKRDLDALLKERNSLNAQIDSFKAEAVNTRRKEADLLKKNAEIEKL
jgi:hypothetical protein